MPPEGRRKQSTQLPSLVWKWRFLSKLFKLGPLEEVPADRGLVLGFLAFLSPDNDGKLEEDGEDEEDELGEIEEASQDDNLFFLFLLFLFFLSFLAFFFLFFLYAFPFSSRCLLVCLSLLLQVSLSYRIPFEKDFPHPLAVAPSSRTGLLGVPTVVYRGMDGWGATPNPNYI